MIVELMHGKPAEEQQVQQLEPAAAATGAAPAGAAPAAAGAPSSTWSVEQHPMLPASTLALEHTNELKGWGSHTAPEAANQHSHVFNKKDTCRVQGSSQEGRIKKEDFACVDYKEADLTRAQFEDFKQHFKGRPVPEQPVPDSELLAAGYEPPNPWVQCFPKERLLNWG